MLLAFFDQPFNSATVVDAIDTFVTSGGSTYPLANKTIDRMGSTLEYSNILANLWNGGFVKNNDSTITLDTTPVPGQQGVLPGIQAIIANAYDQINVGGNPNSNIEEIPVYIGDIDQINQFYYGPAVGSNGIVVSLVNNITSISNASLSWCQLTSADAMGNALTYQATGTALKTDSIAGFSTLAASSMLGTNTLTLVSATGQFYFIPGDFIFINMGNNTQEIGRISSVSYNTLTLANNLNSNHYIGETVYTCAREVWIKYTVPVNTTNGVAANYYNISFNIKAQQYPRP